MLVSKRFRDLVELFEPDQHQFLPVDMFHKKGQDPFDIFYWFICCNLVDSIDRNHTTLTWEGFDYEERMEDGLRRGFWTYDHAVTPPPLPVYSLSAIGNRHLWRDPYRNREYVHCSDAFGEALLTAGLTGFGLMKYQQV